MKYSIVLTTCESTDDAKIIIDTLLKRKLAACIQTQAIESFYTWKGKIEQAKEVLLFIKTRKELYNDIEIAIKSVHKYETPEILEVAADNGLSEYLHWIDDVTEA